MLSYRHAFHAGNHADVLKHFVLFEVLQYFLQKDKPFSYIDTHAGAGMYALQEGYAQKNAEYANGIAKLWHTNASPAVFNAFLAFIQGFNPTSTLQYYPGSPAIAYRMLRECDRLRLFELHPSDYKLLLESIESINRNPKSRKSMIEQLDGFAGIKSALPPPSRRAVVLIDPPYEDKADYKRVVKMLTDSMKRFSTGTYMVWYPLLQRPEVAEMLDDLAQISPENWLNVSMQVQAPSLDGFGMHGSGLYIINPPWTLPTLLQSAMPSLCQQLAVDDQADYQLNSQII